MPRSKVRQSAKERIWRNGKFRLFISHKAGIKSKANELKAALGRFGITCFVAHADIAPTKKWRNEILIALSSMHALVALMTKSFHNSPWTDQEVGYALGRDVPVVPVRLGSDPYGFIGEYQALSCKWSEMPTELIKIFIKNESVRDAYIDVVAECNSFDEGNALAKLLPSIDKLSGNQEKRLIEIYNKNGQVKGSYGFNGEQAQLYGDGLVHHLARITGHKYRVNGFDISIVRLKARRKATNKRR